jgi:parallel beta-helix repeat protein
MKAADFLIFFFVLFFHSFSWAKVIHVPKDYDSIQKAIDASSRNDIIRVAPGTYYENINLREGRNLIGSGADVTFLIDDGKGPPDPVVYIAGDVTIQGFTITGGRGAGVGHAVMVLRGSPRILDNIVRDNSYTGIGLHSEISYTAPFIIGNKLFGNGGAGIANLGSFCKPVIRKNEIFNNTNVGVACTDQAAPFILENNIHDNGAGIGVKDEANAEIFKNLIVGNKLVGINVSKKAKATIRNNNVMTNGSTGINLDKCLHGILEKNTVVDNGAEGIFVKNNSKATIHNNIVTGNLPTVLQVVKSTALLTNNQIYAKQDQGAINVNTIQLKKSKIYMGGNEIIGGVNTADAAEVIELEPNKYTPPPPSIPSAREKLSSGQNIDPGAPNADQIKENSPSSSETATTETKPEPSRGCLFFF